MLLEFRVANYRSIRDEQALNLIASSDDALADTHLARTGLKSAPHAVRSAVVYGPNASGKSTLLLALNYMRAVVAESASVIQPGQTYNVQRFKLDDACADQPTAFELTFLLGGIRHQYAFAMTPQKMVNESLLVYRTAKPTQWFRRQLAADGETYDYEFSAYLSGPRKLWQDSTRANALFLSTAAQLNSELLSPVFRWIVDSIAFLPAAAIVNHDFTTALLATEEGRSIVRDFLASADISIADVKAVPRRGFRNEIVFNASGVTQARQEEGEFLVPMFQHATPRGNATFELHEESEGTQRLYGLAAPVLDVLRDGHVLVVDDIRSNRELLRALLSAHGWNVTADSDVSQPGGQQEWRATHFQHT